jgi:ParB family chromosome partitioning protein
MSAEKKRGLGRGLDALFRDVREEEASYAAKSAEFKPLRADEMVAEAGKLKNPAAAAETKRAAAPAAGLQPIEYKTRPPADSKAPVAPAPDTVPAVKGEGVRMVGVEKLAPGKLQPRRLFAEKAIEELAESIALYGVLQPLLVRPLSASTFEIIGGERRWRAAQKARLHEVPVIVRELDDKQAMEVGLIENLQREDLTPVEEAESYQRLLDEFGHTQETLSQHLGKSRPHIANLLRLLKLPESVRTLVQQGALSAGHARALLNATDPAAIAGEIVSKGLSVRQVERMARGQQAVARGLKPPKMPPGMIVKDVDTLALERKMTSLLGLSVTIEGEDGKGRLTVEYSTLEQLDDLLARLSAVPAI